MKCIDSKITFFLSSILLLSPAYANTYTKTLYSTSKAQAFESNLRGDYYIQLGNFKHRANAQRLLRAAQVKTSHSIWIHELTGRYIVSVGPMHSAKEVRAAGLELTALQPTSTPVTARKTQIPKTQIIEPPRVSTQDSWFVAGAAGVQNANINRYLTANNGSSYASPYNKDSYSTQADTAALIAAEVGYRWQRHEQWLPYYSLSLYYNHLFATNIGDQITQYSLPDFTNYNYNWNVSSDVLLPSLKLNLFQYNQLMPYINGGVGIAFNHASNYSETPLTGITARISPAFTNNTSTEFAYKLGAGVDWSINSQWMLSAGYAFEALGNISSGNGVTTWAGDALQSHAYQTNTALLSVSYLFK